MPFDILICLFPVFFATLSHGVSRVCTLGAASTASRTGGVAGHSLTALLLHCKRGWHHLIVSPEQCCLGEGWVVLVKCLLSALCPNFYIYFLLQWHAGVSPRKGGTSAVSLSSTVPVRVSTLQVFSQLGREELGQVCCSAGSATCTGVCMPITRCIGGQESSPVPWCLGVGSYNFHKVAFVHG